MKAKEGECWESGKSRRIVKELNGPIFDPRGRRLEVIYSLYMRVELWQQHGNSSHHEWWIEREGFCSIATWERWERKAVKVST